MQNLDECSLAIYSDLSYNNLDIGGSQGGFVIFLMDKTGRLPPMWQICWVVKSTMVVETLALVDAGEASFGYLSYFLSYAALQKNLLCYH